MDKEVKKETNLQFSFVVAVGVVADDDGVVIPVEVGSLIP